MKDRMVYEFAVLRLVPRVEREEFINIGVALFCKNANFLDVKIKINEVKAKAIHDAIDLDEVNSYLNSFMMIARGELGGGPIATYDLPSRFRWLTAKRSTVVQLSFIHSGLTNDPEATLQNLFFEMVG
jgi:hypothetical protein